MKVKIKFEHWLPKLFNVGGITLYPRKRILRDCFLGCSCKPGLVAVFLKLNREFK